MNDLSEIFDGVPFDPFAVEPQGDFKIVPPGKTPVLIEEAEVKLNKKKTGHYIRLQMNILDGPCKGQKLFDQINIQNPSAECVEIGLRTLSALARAIGLQTVTDTTQLLNQVVIAHVKVKEEQNSIRTYSAASQASAISAPTPATPENPAVERSTPELAPPVAPQQPATSEKPPWQR